jgi:hypothetical protein
MASSKFFGRKATRETASEPTSSDIVEGEVADTKKASKSLRLSPPEMETDRTGIHWTKDGSELNTLPAKPPAGDAVYLCSRRRAGE